MFHFRIARVGFFLLVCSMVSIPQAWCGCFRGSTWMLEAAQQDVSILQASVPKEAVPVAEKEAGLAVGAADHLAWRSVGLGFWAGA